MSPWERFGTVLTFILVTGIMYHVLTTLATA